MAEVTMQNRYVEPWSLSIKKGPGKIVIVDGDGEVVVESPLDSVRQWREGLRMVACVNAMAGVPDEEVGDGVAR